MSTAFSYAISEQNATLANWICGALALAILIARLIGHRWQRCRWDATAWIVMLSIAVLIARIVCNAVVLRDQGITEEASVASLRARSITTLIVRVLVTTFYWLQCTLLLLFYRDMLDHITWILRLINFCWLFMGCTYVAVILTTFLECRPINHYWTPPPSSQDPYKCTLAYGQLFTQCISIALIDTLLLLISAPILRSSIRLFPRNLQLGVLYILGFFSLIIIGFRLHFIRQDGSAQRARSFWASVQVVTAAFVANAPSVYGAWRNLGRRKESVVSLGRVRTRESGGEEGMVRVLPAALMRL